MKAVAFTLFGDDRKYHVGAIANMLLCQKHYPGWTPIFFCGPTALDTPIELHKIGATVFGPIPFVGGIYWRHLIPDIFPDIERYIVRDTDSRINQREVDAVNAWIASGKTFHIMRDHARHTCHVMQGMYGVKGNALSPLEPRFRNVPNVRGAVVELFQTLYAVHMMHDCVEHGSFNMDTFPRQVPFPTDYGDHRFVGEIFDEFNSHNDDWKEVLVQEC